MSILTNTFGVEGNPEIRSALWGDEFGITLKTTQSLRWENLEVNWERTPSCGTSRADVVTPRWKGTKQYLSVRTFSIFYNRKVRVGNL